MRLDANSTAILRLAWARTLGLADEAFDPATLGSAEHLHRVDQRHLTVVNLFGRQAISGPQWVLSKVGDPASSDQTGPLTEPANLRALLGARPSRIVLDQVITAGDGYLDHPGLTETPISDDPAALADLQHACPPDDVSQADLGSADASFVALDDADLPAAAAGYHEQSGFLANLAALTVPSHRRRGWATKAAGIALNDALDAGLIPQLRHPTGNLAVAGLARSLGLSPVGRCTRLQLGS